MVSVTFFSFLFRNYEFANEVTQLSRWIRTIYRKIHNSNLILPIFWNTDLLQ